MQKERCISVCEIIEHIHGIEPQFEQIIKEINHMAGYTDCDRIYMGSSFCGQYFLHLSIKLIKELMAVCKKQNIKVTLVLPIFTEKNLQEGKNKLERLLTEFKSEIDEVTVNDYGMLLYVHEHYPQIGLNMGRLFMKDYREPRYEEYFNQVFKPRSFTNYLKEMIKRYKVQYLEFDPTHKKIDFSEKPEGVQIGIYTPYAYMTVGQICELGGISKSVDKKFRPNESCMAECYKHRMRYFMGDDRVWRRIGRAIYFENKEVEIIGLNQVREIYAPLDWEV